MNRNDLLIYNGEVLSESDAKGCYSNRAFKYGDGVFESIRLVSGRPCFTASHFSRLQEGLAALSIQLPVNFSSDSLESLIVSLAECRGITLGGRVRVTVFRDAGGFFRPEQDSSSYVITAEPIDDNEYRLNLEGISIDVYNDIRKPVSPLSPYKTLNNQIYLMAAMWARKCNLDDCVLTNYNHSIIEASSSNLFIVSNGVLYTPSVSDGCLGGVMRMQVINLALEHGLKVYECALTPQNLLVADEVFLTNAIAGIRWVGSYKTKRYFNTVSKRINDMINRSVLSSVMDL